MSDRLSPLDLPFLYVEGPTLPMHVGSVAVFETPAGGFAPGELVGLIGEQVAQLPRYRQRLRHVPGHVAAPIWVDDARFELDYHVRQSALPRPGSPEQLRELVARVQGRQLNRARPLWELYLVDGLAEGSRFALVTKTHEIMVDADVPDLVQVILSSEPAAVRRNGGTSHAGTQPARARTPDPSRVDGQPAPDDVDRAGAAGEDNGEPSDWDLLRGALADLVGHPSRIGGAVRHAVSDLRGTAWRLGQLAGRSVADLAKIGSRISGRAAPSSPLNVVVGETRRYAP